MKKSGSNSGNASRSPFPQPRSSEKFVSDAGERMTRIDLGPPFLKPFVDSADRLMAAAHQSAGILNLDLTWHFVLPWLDNPQPEKDQFWESFNLPDAEEQRRVALSGVKFKNYTKERQVLGLVDEFKALLGIVPIHANIATGPLSQSISPTDEQRKTLLDEILKRLGGWLLEAVLSDHTAPKRLHELLKSNKADQSEYYDQPTVPGRFFKAFALELSINWRLPTKKKVRNAAGFGDSNTDEITASRAFRKLGLAGLPEA